MTLGYPTPDKFLEFVGLIEKYCVNIIEIGIPPKYAKYDGPLIRKSYEHVKTLGLDYWELLKEVRKRIDIPIVVLTYLDEWINNLDYLIDRLRKIGIDSLLLPDLLIDYIDSFEDVIEKTKDVGLTIFTSPVMPDKLIEKISTISKLFLYYGIRPTTGIPIPVDPVVLVKRIRPIVRNKLVVGFGLSLNDIAGVLRAGADGIAVGSILVDMISKNSIECIVKMLRDLRAIIDGV